MLAKTIELHFHATPPLHVLSGLALSAITKADRATEEPQAAAATTKPPAIGTVWPEHGGIYVGVARGEDGAPDGYLILADLPYQTHDWGDALKAAADLDHAGHRDWRVPTRSESALLYANVRDQIETGGWYWTGTKHSDGRAWGQIFSDGYQDNGNADYEGRVRFVRRLPL